MAGVARSAVADLERRILRLEQVVWQPDVLRECPDLVIDDRARLTLEALGIKPRGARRGTTQVVRVETEHGVVQLVQIESGAWVPLDYLGNVLR